MINNKIHAFQVPRIILTEKWDFELKKLLKAMDGSKVFLSVFQDAKDNLKVIHSGVNEDMYALLQTTFHRNIEFFDLIKLSLINADKFRNGEMNEAFEIMTRGVEYITIKNSKILNL